MTQLNVLVLGASYGLLPAVRILLAGHRVTVVCRTEEQTALIANGASVSFLRRNGDPDMTLTVAAAHAPAGAGELGVSGTVFDVAGFDIVFCAMSEPQYADPAVAALLRRIASARLPVVSLMNALPPPFLVRLGTLDVDQLRPAYTSWSIWEELDPELVSAASPDAQAVRQSPDQPNALSVTLASNFKVAPFVRPEQQALIEMIASDVSAYRPEGRPLPVRILAHPSLHVPLAKWPMLIAGNCRCLQPDGRAVSIADAVWADPEVSQRIYDRVLDIVQAAGAAKHDLVPFAHYAKAASSLSRPSSFARALVNGAANIERVDRMVQLCGRTFGIELAELDVIVEQVNRVLADRR